MWDGGLDAHPVSLLVLPDERGMLAAAPPLIADGVLVGSAFVAGYVSSWSP
jgi:hypothetical protein